jgi:plasmid maintenance system antidote protein VapI
MSHKVDSKLRPLEALLERKGSISAVAKSLGYSYSYVHQVLDGRFPVTKKMQAKIHKVLNRKPPMPRIVVTFLNKKDYLEAKKMSMKERRELFK